MTYTSALSASFNKFIDGTIWHYLILMYLFNFAYIYICTAAYEVN